jgi:predicted  nucleic acid-binding Zn-ribbon protein
MIKKWIIKVIGESDSNVIKWFQNKIDNQQETITSLTNDLKDANRRIEELEEEKIKIEEFLKSIKNKNKSNDNG